MKGESRKSVVAAYKERKIATGIYALRCIPTGDCWVGRAPDLSTIRNRIWFTLRHGSHSHRGLQATWNAHGADAFTFEIVETIAAEDSAYIRDKMLKARLQHWQSQHGAEAL